jgi:hypothetical protein|tara:strand:+ start:1755 stop:2354 length:600 start_codon:yes stop_codon:yes gene_type:complete
MPRDKRLSRPQDYLDEVDLFFRKGSKGLRKIDYEESFRAKSDQPPFDINRFGKEELLNKITSKKPTLNRRLDFVDDPTSFELFTGLGRFDNGRTSEEDPSMSLYSFDEGRANTKLDFRQTPEYQAKGELWKERYMLSPTISPGDRITNPMPRVANPDPKNYLLMTAKKRAENEMEGNLNVAQLLSASQGEIAEAESKGA